MKGFRAFWFVHGSATERAAVHLEFWVRLRVLLLRLGGFGVQRQGFGSGGLTVYEVYITYLACNCFPHVECNVMCRKQERLVGDRNTSKTLHSVRIPTLQTSLKPEECNRPTPKTEAVCLSKHLDTINPERDKPRYNHEKLHKFL